MESKKLQPDVYAWAVAVGIPRKQSKADMTQASLTKTDTTEALNI